MAGKLVSKMIYAFIVTTKDSVRQRTNKRKVPLRDDKKYDSYARLATQCGSGSSSAHERYQCTRDDLVEYRSRINKSLHFAALKCHHLNGTAFKCNPSLGRSLLFLTAEIV